MLDFHSMWTFIRCTVHVFGIEEVARKFCHKILIGVNISEDYKYMNNFLINLPKISFSKIVL